MGRRREKTLGFAWQDTRGRRSGVRARVLLGGTVWLVGLVLAPAAPVRGQGEPPAGTRPATPPVAKPAPGKSAKPPRSGPPEERGEAALEREERFEPTERIDAEAVVSFPADI